MLDRPFRSWVALAASSLMLAACGGGGVEEPPTLATQTVAGPEGAQLLFTPAEAAPAGALTITPDAAGAPPLPAEVRAVGPVLRFGPVAEVGQQVEIRVPVDASRLLGREPRLLIASGGRSDWSEIDARVEGAVLVARVPLLGHAVAVVDAESSDRARPASATALRLVLRANLSSEPPLDGGGLLRTARQPSQLAIRLDATFGRACSGTAQLRLGALFVPRPGPDGRTAAARWVSLGERAVTGTQASATFGQPITAADNGSWVYLPEARCVENGRLRAAAIALLPVLQVRIEGGGPPVPPVVSASIGASGGALAGPDGVRLVVPAGSLPQDQVFRIARDATGAPGLPGGIELASEIYAVTPHGQVFGEGASIEIPSSPSRAAGRPTFLMKAQPGGRWSVVAQGTADAAALRASITSLSFLAVGVCTRNLPGGTPLAQACPADHSLRLELLDGNAVPIPVIADANGVVQPVLTVTAPRTLGVRLVWTRPAGTNRFDVVDTGSVVTSTSTSLVLSREAGMDFGAQAPRELPVNEDSISRIFDVLVDPLRVAGAQGPNGIVRPIAAQVRYSVPPTAGFGAADWDFDVSIPIRVRRVALAPQITQQPQPTSVTVSQNASFSLVAMATGNALSYEWRYFVGPNDTLGSPAEGVRNLATYNSPPAPLAFDGRRYFVRVCSSPSGSPAPVCVDSTTVPVTVLSPQIQATFTTQPSDQQVTEGQAMAISAGVSGAASLAWFRDVACTANPSGLPACSGTLLRDGPGTGPFTGATLAGAATSSLGVGPLALGANGTTLALRALDPSGQAVWSRIALLTVRSSSVPPSFQQVPTPQSAPVGGTVTFTAEALGTPVPTLTWTLEGIAVSTSSGPVQTGSCNATLTVTAVSLTLADLRPGCNGATIGVVARNGVQPDARATAELTVLPLAPLFVLQPASVDAFVGESAVFTVRATGSPAPEVRWQTAEPGGTWSDVDPASLPGCGPTPPQANGDDTLASCTLDSLAAYDNGRRWRALATNPSATGPTVSAEATALVRPQAGTAPQWLGPVVKLNGAPTVGEPRPGLALDAGVLTTNAGGLAFVDLSLPLNPANLLPQAVAGSYTVIGGANTTRRAVLWTQNTLGSTCSGGNRLVGVVLAENLEGGTNASPIQVLHDAGSGCVLGVMGAQTPLGFVFALNTSQGQILTGRFWTDFDRPSQVWSPPVVGTTPLVLGAGCEAGGGVGDNRMAGTYDSWADPQRSPARIAVMAIDVSSSGTPSTCVATLASDGVWSSLSPLWTTGRDPNGAPVLSEPVVAMDPAGNALLAAVRRPGSDYQLATAHLPVGASTWQVGTALPAFGPALPSLRVAPDGRARLLYRTQPSPTATFTTVYASLRPANGDWQARRRLFTDDVETFFPRLSMSFSGGAVAVFSARTGDGGATQVWAASDFGSGWGPAGPLPQSSTSASSRFAAGAPYLFGEVGGVPRLRVYWQENAGQRLLSADLLR